MQDRSSARGRRRRRSGGVFDGAEAHRYLALEFVVQAHHGDFDDGRMRLQGLLDFPGAEAVAGGVDDVVGAAEDEKVAVGIAYAQSDELYSNSFSNWP